MGKKKMMKLSSLFRGVSGGLLAVPLCYNAKTLSFRVVGDDMIKTVNSVFFEGGDVLDAETPESWFTNSSETASHSTESDQDLDAESLEMVVRGVVRSERLFFDPGVTTSSILLEETSKTERDSKSKAAAEAAAEEEEEDRDCIYTPPIEEISVPVAMESEDPYGDFRRSMEEMVRSHGELAKDWRSLESMLAWYLRMNGKRSHGVIVSAFVDLLSGLSDSGAGESSVSDSARYSTAVSSLPTSPLCSSSRGLTEIEEEEERRSC
ncbi:Transcription repressor OFP13 [Raphanus sativus]|uniref:Transcription repressor n=1 Tax=Raphanus sativus TaxID=3726 RepID=A0A6J0KC52_RAPSA|nr:transcription repressor OFP13 [Raphanus sativus]KAJ4883494.1 Transcription repressor OFP13 [Raphanus sativus]